MGGKLERGIIGLLQGNSQVSALENLNHEWHHFHPRGHLPIVVSDGPIVADDAGGVVRDVERCRRTSHTSPSGCCPAGPGERDRDQYQRFDGRVALRQFWLWPSLRGLIADWQQRWSRGV